MNYRYVLIHYIMVENAECTNISYTSFGMTYVSLATSTPTHFLHLSSGYMVVHPVKFNMRCHSYIARWWWQGSPWLLSAGVSSDVRYSFERFKWGPVHTYRVFVCIGAVHLLVSSVMRVNMAQYHFASDKNLILSYQPVVVFVTSYMLVVGR